MSTLKHLSLIYYYLLVVAMILMPRCQCEVLQPDDVKLIEQTCKNTPLPNLCLQLLKPDPRSPSADVRGLALIIVDVLKARSKEGANKVNQLLKSGGGDIKVLNFCAEVYKLLLTANVPVAINALELGDPKFAENAVSDAALEVMNCEDDFHGKSPLTKENTGTHDVSNVARAIIRNLL
ncbi:hypothetical protein VNO78_11958 [Psophocarpus tetragonolobus]|uniref:Pectinesterase inhibitor domain-containing protein n=1 Tax=Psophocarpus tetragonolobus TaxID=3891 RepID=A0AAN9SML9_PSOTE